MSIPSSLLWWPLLLCPFSRNVVVIHFQLEWHHRCLLVYSVFGSSMIFVRYLLDQRFTKWSNKILLNSLFAVIVLSSWIFTSLWISFVEIILPCKRWDSVSSSGSLMSKCIFVSVPLFIIVSISVSISIKDCSLTSALPKHSAKSSSLNQHSAIPRQSFWIDFSVDVQVQLTL